MKHGGVTATGSYHSTNQDSFCTGEFPQGYYLVVADGLGSCNFSKKGSLAICKVIEKLSMHERFVELLQNKNKFIKLLHINWLHVLKSSNKYPVTDSYTTVLTVIYTKDFVYLIRLGDGALVAVLEDAQVALYDDKSELFANQTYCLTEQLSLDKWEYHVVPTEKFCGAVAFTDGVCVPESELENFACDFLHSYKHQSTSQIQADVKTWLPNFNNQDDKTLAFMQVEKEG